MLINEKTQSILQTANRHNQYATFIFISIFGSRYDAFSALIFVKFGVLKRFCSVFWNF
jgi:hypothetical protein